MSGIILYFSIVILVGTFCLSGSEYIIFEEDSNCQYNMPDALFF